MRNIWVGIDKRTGQLWVYEKTLDRNDPDEVLLFRIDRHESGFRTTYSDELGAYVLVDRADYRKRLKTADENTRAVCVSTYEWFKDLCAEEEKERLRQIELETNDIHRWTEMP